MAGNKKQKIILGSDGLSASVFPDREPVPCDKRTFGMVAKSKLIEPDTEPDGLACSFFFVKQADQLEVLGCYRGYLKHVEGTTITIFVFPSKGRGTDGKTYRASWGQGRKEGQGKIKKFWNSGKNYRLIMEDRNSDEYKRQMQEYMASHQEFYENKREDRRLAQEMREKAMGGGNSKGKDYVDEFRNSMNGKKEEETIELKTDDIDLFADE